MSYHFTKIIETDFETATAKTTEELKKEGFGVLTEINIADTLKNKLNVDFRKYKILGACNPHFAYKALQAEDNIGTMLPCNVILQEKEPGKIQVSAVDPIASMNSIDNSSLAPIATEVQEKLKKVIENL